MKSFLPYIVVMLGMLLPGHAFAADPIPNILDQFQAITQAMGNAMVDQGEHLLFSLMGLQFTITGLKNILHERDLMVQVRHMTWTLVTCTSYFLFITKSGTWIPYVIDSWNGLGATATGQSQGLSPGAVFSMGVQVVEGIRNALAVKAGSSVVDFLKMGAISLQVVFVEVFILLSFLVLAGQLALALIRAYLWGCLNPILLGFGGLSYTRDIAVNSLKSGISIGIVILTCYAIAGLAQASTAIFIQQINSFTLSNWVPLWNCVGLSAFLALGAWQAPRIANDLLNGGFSGGIGETMATGAVAAAGAAAITGGVGGVAAQAASTGAQSLGGVIQAGAAGMGAAGDLGKTGLDAVGHAASQVVSHGGGVVGGSIRKMVEGATSGLQAGMDNSIGGRTAQSIEASRGGHISPAGSSGGGTGAAASSAPGSSGADASTAGGTNPGQAGTASFSATGTAGTGGISNEDLGKHLENLTQSLSGNKPTAAQRLRDAASYIPNDPQHGVSVNANLGGGNHEQG